MKEFLDLGLHFGHLRSYTHPKAKPYVYSILNGVCIINLEKTKETLEEALKFVRQLGKQNKTILFIGTKRQAASVIAEEAEKLNLPYIHKRYMGGTLTNFETILKNINKLAELEKITEEMKNQKGEKKKLRQLIRKKDRLTETLGGLKYMTKLPDAIFVVDVAREKNAVLEARRLGIPIIGIVDTNADPSKIDYPIIANDDSQKGVEFIIKQVVAEYSSQGKEHSDNTKKTKRRKKEENG